MESTNFCKPSTSELIYEILSGFLMRSISYFPYSEDLSHPGDRRRIKIWSDHYGYPLNINSVGLEDLLVLSSSCSLRKLAFNHKGPVVIDLVDGYLSNSTPFMQDFSRNSLRFYLGKSSLRSITFTRELIAAISRADAVIVSCQEQADQVNKYNSNIHCILDDHSELTTFATNRETSIKDFTIIWEGLGFTLKHLIAIASELEEFLLGKRAKLIVVTNNSFNKLSGRFGRVETRALLKRAFKRAFEQVELVNWSVESLQEAAKRACVAIIPLSQKDSFALAKPENKLLSFWCLGLNVLCSPSPAYARVLGSVQQETHLVSDTKWLHGLTYFYDRLKDSPYSLLYLDDRIKSYLEKTHTREILVGKWDKALRPFL